LKKKRKIKKCNYVISQYFGIRKGYNNEERGSIGVDALPTPPPLIIEDY